MCQGIASKVYFLDNMKIVGKLTMASNKEEEVESDKIKDEVKEAIANILRQISHQE